MILGLVFGASAPSVGIDPNLAMLMSAAVYSGAGQFAALPLWQQGGLAVVLATLALSLRFVLMSASLRPSLRHLGPWRRGAMAFFLTDENYALAISRGRGDAFDPAYLFGSGLVLWAAWLVGTVGGVSFGSQVPPLLAEPAQAVFPIAFLVIVVLCCVSREMAMVAVLAALLSTAGSLLLPGGWHVVAAGLAASLVGPVLERARR
jgi:predicted branched-subunit amino acid permease